MAALAHVESYACIQHGTKAVHAITNASPTSHTLSLFDKRLLSHNALDARLSSVLNFSIPYGLSLQEVLCPTSCLLIRSTVKAQSRVCPDNASNLLLQSDSMSLS